MYTNSQILTQQVNPYHSHYNYQYTNYINAYNPYTPLNDYYQFQTIKRIPIKIILNDDAEVLSEENSSETTEEMSIYQSPGKKKSIILGNFINNGIFNQIQMNWSKWTAKKNIKRNKKDSHPEKMIYIFTILKSRKKEKKYLRKKFNKVISRVHNMDCLLKKIKAYNFI